MGVLYNRLLILMNETQADNTFYHIALLMLQNFDQLVKLSIQEVAELCSVSKPTISKFIRAFGLMFSATAAIDLQIKLGRLGRYIATNMNDRKMADFLRRADADTLVILFSDNGNFMDRREMIDPETNTNLFNQTQARLVMITSNQAMAKDPRLNYTVTYRRLTQPQDDRLLPEVLPGSV